MQMVTLITDWQDADFYVATLKAHLLAAFPEVVIVDISHRVPAFNTLQAAYLLRGTYAHFPKGTIHLIGVNSEASPFNKLVIAEADGHFFVAPNDGILSLALDNAPAEAVEMPIPGGISGFKSVLTFKRAVQAITLGTIDDAGIKTELQHALMSYPTYDSQWITGRVMYIDSFGNAITNIDRRLFESICGDRRFELMVQTHHHKITRLSHYYDDVPPGTILALFNSLQLLEIAINQGNVAQREGLDTTASIRIKFL